MSSLSVILPALLAALLIDVSSSASLPSSEGNGYVKLPVAARPVQREEYLALSERQVEADLGTLAPGTYYSVQVALGDPGQQVELLFNTASSDFWVNPNCTATKEADRSACLKRPRYALSSTAKQTNVYAKSTYPGNGVDNPYALYQYIQDYVTIASVRLKDQTFGDAVETNLVPFGIMGVGPRRTYTNIIDSLVSQGAIQSRAFSVDIRKSPDEGSVIFGGVDTKKYKGKLKKVPAITDGEQSAATLTSLGITLPGKSSQSLYSSSSSGSPADATLDTTSAYIRLPKRMMDALAAAFPTAKPKTWSDGFKSYVVDCAVADQPGSVDFGFHDVTLSMPFRHAVWRDPDECTLLFFADDTYPVLGQPFMAAMYTVFDYDNSNFYFAGAADCGSHIVPIGKGVNAVPTPKGDC